MDKVNELTDQLTLSTAWLSNSNDVVFATMQMVYNAYLPMYSIIIFSFNQHYVNYVDFESFVFGFQVVFFSEGYQMLMFPSFP